MTGKNNLIDIEDDKCEGIERLEDIVYTSQSKEKKFLESKWCR